MKDTKVQNTTKEQTIVAIVTRIVHTTLENIILVTNCVSVFDHFVGLGLKGLKCENMASPWQINLIIRRSVK